MILYRGIDGVEIYPSEDLRLATISAAMTNGIGRCELTYYLYYYRAFLMILVDQFCRLNVRIRVLNVCE